MSAEKPVSQLTILGRGMTKRCGRCGQGGLFHRWTEMVDSCPRCRLVFSREDGYWTGSLMMNTIVSLVLFSLIIGIMVALTWPNIPVYQTMAIGIVAGIVFPYVYHPFSRTTWVAIDLAFMHPELMHPKAGLTTER